MTTSIARTPHPSDVSDEEWHVIAPWLTLMIQLGPQRDYDLRWIVRTGSPWRSMQHDLPSWHTVEQEMRALDTRWRLRDHRG